jgi:hypothetical protein
VIPSNIDIGVKQRLESLTQAVGLPTATAYSINFPTPNAGNRGDFIIVRNASNVDTLYVCVLTSGGVYTWWPVVQSS